MDTDKEVMNFNYSEIIRMLEVDKHESEVYIEELEERISVLESQLSFCKDFIKECL